MRLRSLRLVLGVSFTLAAAICASGQSQTDIALSLYGAFTNSTTPGNSDFFRVNPAASAGGLLEFRHISNPLFGWEATYSFRRANEVYDELVYVPAVCAPSGCPVIPYPTYAVSANAQEFTADWVPSAKIASLRPFAILGTGILMTQPVSGQPGTAGTTQPAFVYGAGLDWGFARHLGVRIQFRGNLYRPPGIAPPNNTNHNIGFMHTAEPAIGLYYKF